MQRQNQLKFLEYITNKKTKKGGKKIKKKTKRKPIRRR